MMDDLKELLEQIAHTDLRTGGLPAHTFDTSKEAAEALTSKDAEIAALKKELMVADKYRLGSDEWDKKWRDQEANGN